MHQDNYITDETSPAEFVLLFFDSLLSYGDHVPYFQNVVRLFREVETDLNEGNHLTIAEIEDLFSSFMHAGNTPDSSHNDNHSEQPLGLKTRKTSYKPKSAHRKIHHHHQNYMKYLSPSEHSNNSDTNQMHFADDGNDPNRCDDDNCYRNDNDDCTHQDDNISEDDDNCYRNNNDDCTYQDNDISCHENAHYDSYSNGDHSSYSIPNDNGCY